MSYPGSYPGFARLVAKLGDRWRTLLSGQFESDTRIFPAYWLPSERPRTLANVYEISGPAHHRTSAENAYFCRLFANSNIAVTPKVTPFHSARDLGRKIVSIWPAERPKPSSLDSFSSSMGTAITGKAFPLQPPMRRDNVDKRRHDLGRARLILSRSLATRVL
jgi:hypothetical protein